MRYTFGEAKRILACAAHVHGGADIGEKINSAVMSLAGLSGWEFMRRLVRIFSASPEFSLPQGVAGLVRACVNGRPASIHGTDYQFLHSGPGDLSSPPHGFHMLRPSDIADIGYHPLAVRPPFPMKLAAVSRYVTEPRPSDGLTRPQPPVVVTGYGPDGSSVRQVLTVSQGSPVDPPDAVYFDNVVFSDVEAVVLDDAVDEYITLFAQLPDGRVVQVGDYHPSDKVPRFHHYRVAGGRGPYDMLVEARIEPLPCISDSDVIPLPSLEPVKYMLLYDANLMMNENQTAQQYLQQAVSWLQSMQTADNTIQTPVVVNNLFDGSQGELSDEYVNL